MSTFYSSMITTIALVLVVDSGLDVDRIKLLPLVDDVKEIRVLADAWIQPVEGNPWVGFVFDGRDAGTSFWEGEWTRACPAWEFEDWALMTSGKVLQVECGRWSREPCEVESIDVLVGIENRSWAQMKQLWR